MVLHLSKILLKYSTNAKTKQLSEPSNRYLRNSLLSSSAWSLLVVAVWSFSARLISVLEKKRTRTRSHAKVLRTTLVLASACHSTASTMSSNVFNN